MPQLTLIYPGIGRFQGDSYIRSWQMQPLSMAVLAGLTPSHWDVSFFDDRLEEIDYDSPTDLVAISIESFTARRGYQIASAFRERGIPVVMGGYHATFCPDEVLEYADAVCTGEAEGIWQEILCDLEAGHMKGKYSAGENKTLQGIKMDRRIFEDKNYFSLALVETGRGCPFQCNFCSITAFHHRRYRRRPVEEIVAELNDLNEDYVFFVDDNMLGSIEDAVELFTALKSLKIKWVGQVSINALSDSGLVSLMAESGCIGVLIGFESLSTENLAEMKKAINKVDDYSRVLGILRRNGVVIYGTFVFGYPHDNEDLFKRTVEFALKEKFFLAAFNHIVPFPGTPLYKELEEAGKLIYPRWWLHDEYRFGSPPFHPPSMTPEMLEQLCHRARRKFFHPFSIIRRGIDPRANCATVKKVLSFFGLNFLLLKEITQKRGIPLGIRERDPVR